MPRVFSSYGDSNAGPVPEIGDPEERVIMKSTRIVLSATALFAVAAFGSSAMALDVKKSIDVVAAPDAVWKAIGDFCGIGTWHPAVEKCELQQKDGRTFRLLSLKGGGQILEQQAAIEEQLVPLIRVLKERDIALRIGVNHGSLADRLTVMYGDTPEGMVQSALEFVEIWNKNSGARISTYVLYGVAGSRCCVLNGAAARTCQVGDEVIIASATYGDVEEVISASPTVLTFRPDNEVAEEIGYRVFRNEAGELDMTIESGGAVVPIRALVG